jgi:hypothetical protein
MPAKRGQMSRVIGDVAAHGHFGHAEQFGGVAKMQDAPFGKRADQGEDALGLAERHGLGDFQ